MAEYEIPQVGGASKGDDEEVIEEIDQGVIDQAHFAGLTEKEAYDVFIKECICKDCLMLQMCKIGSAGIENSLTTIKRCLAYLPPIK